MSRSFGCKCKFTFFPDGGGLSLEPGSGVVFFGFSSSIPGPVTCRRGSAPVSEEVLPTFVTSSWPF